MKNEFFEIRLGFISNVEKYGWDKAVMDFKKNLIFQKQQLKNGGNGTKRKFVFHLFNTKQILDLKRLKVKKVQGLRLKICLLL